jgi:hypothetical protein
MISKHAFRRIHDLTVHINYRFTSTITLHTSHSINGIYTRVSKLAFVR